MPCHCMASAPKAKLLHGTAIEEPACRDNGHIDFDRIKGNNTSRYITRVLETAALAAFNNQPVPTPLP